jgi:transcriptional regulator with XRE-family HTH domain
MKSKQKEMVALLVKEGRLAKGYTQKELSELSNISIRSIQRRENGEIVPRSYTLKTIAEFWDCPLKTLPKERKNKISF